jgi:ClpP class serine protease
MAHPTTITGSIGVIAILPGIKEMLNKTGIYYIWLPGLPE